MSRYRRRRGRGDDGSSDALGLALIAPAAIGLGIVVLFLSRQVDTRATAQSAAEAAAQAAAQERSPAAAIVAAESVGTAMLTDELTCSSPTIEVDVSRFLDPVDPTVSVAVSCTTSGIGLETIDAPLHDAQTFIAFATLDPFRATRP